MNIKIFCDFLIKKGKIILIFLIVSVILSIIGIFRVKINTSFDLFAPRHSIYKDAKKIMNDAFGDESQILLLAPGKLTPQGIKKIYIFSNQCSKINGISKVMLPFTESLISKSNEDIIKEINRLTTINIGVKSIIIEKNTTWFLIRLEVAKNSNYRKIVKALKSLSDKQMKGYLIAGEPLLESVLFDYILKILIFLPPLAIILMLLVFRLRIGSFRATILSMIPASLGAILTLGILSWVRGSISIISVLAPIFIIVLGSADGLHVTSHVMDQLGKGYSNKDAIINTLKAVGIPIILTTLTTMVGFLSLITITSNAILELAITAAGGIMLAGIVTWIILPILLFHQKPLPAKDQKKTSKLAVFLFKLKGFPSIIITLFILGISIFGILRVKSNFSIADIYKPNTKVRKSIEEFSKHTGGAYPQIILIKNDNKFNNDLALNILQFQKQLKDDKLITASVSIYTIIEEIAKSKMHLKKYPKHKSLAKMIVSKIKKQNPEIYDNFNSDNGWTRILLFTKDQNSKTLKNIADKVKKLEKDTGQIAYPVGTSFEMMSLNIKIIPQLIESMLIALLSVFLLTSIFIRSIKAGLFSILPILITLCGLLGVMGFMKIDISVITSIMSGLTIGVGIDYAIHFTSLFYYFKRNGHTNPAKETLYFVATPILANAMGLSFGFTVMILSPLQIHTTLSILMWVTMVLSSFLSLSFLPTLFAKRNNHWL